MPDSVGEIFNRRGTVATLWAIMPVSGIQINCHFFGSEEIEFDLAPTDVVGQTELDVVVQFALLIGRASVGSPRACVMRAGPTRHSWSLTRPPTS